MRILGLAGLNGLFSVTLVLGAALLFWIQLLVSKLLLPVLGGSPAVWNTCLVFFQMALLAGYLYAHATVRWWGGRLQPWLHPCLLLAAGLVLPVSLAGIGLPTDQANPLLWLLQALFLLIGAPFIVLAGTAPLLQTWFVRARTRWSADPYFLYAASNLGSMAALLSYPTVIEPALPLAAQSRWWAAGYGLLIGLTALCAVAARRFAGTAIDAVAEVAEVVPKWRLLGRRLHWILLAFTPSSLLLGVTTHLTTDVAAAPLFWVVPLVLYLLTYVIAFQQSVRVPAGLVRAIQPWLVLLLAVVLLRGWQDHPVRQFALHLTTFFVTALLCHLELARLRPAPARLTEYYLLIAFGGALGGMFNALLAPLLFDGVVEYPLALVLACLLRPGPWPRRGGGVMKAVNDLLLPLLLFGLLAVIGQVLELDFAAENKRMLVVVLVAALAVAAFQRRPLRFGLGVAALFSALALGTQSGDMLLRLRNFYGQLTVMAQEAPPTHVLLHGTTTHGMQSLDPAHRLDPLSYYHHEGPLGHLFADLEGRRPLQRVGVVGLGTGTVACYGRSDEHWTFFEINPAVVGIARDPRLFTFLRDCPARPEIVLGDARLSLARQADDSFDLIVLDAFNSDAIPVHLVTEEAVALYLTKLRRGGLLVFHISNRYLDLAPVLGNIAARRGLTARIYLDAADSDDTGDPRPDPKDASDWVVMGREATDLSPLAGTPKWTRLAGKARLGVWTDDYSNLLSVLLR